MGGCKSQGNTRPAANARGMDEKEKEREKEKETGSRIGCDISSRSSSVRKKKKNAMMDSFNQLGSFFTASSKRINDSSGKMRNSHIDVSQKTKERDKKVDDFDKDRLYDSYKKEIGSMRGKDRERDEEKEKDRDKDRDKSKDRDRDKDKEVELALGQGYGPKSGLRLGLSIPDTDTTALQYLALQGTAPQGVGVKEEARENENGNKNEDDDEDDDGYSRHESVGTFPTINDGVSSM